jgi:hypothetical protein
MFDRLDVRIFGGYVWYAYPLNDFQDRWEAALKALLPPLGSKTLPICHMEEQKVFAYYRKDGLIVVTQTPEKPPVPSGWEVVAITLSDGARYDDGKQKVLYVHTVTPENPDLVYGIFVGLALPVSYSHSENSV